MYICIYVYLYIDRQRSLTSFRWAPPTDPESTIKATVRRGSSLSRPMSSSTAGGHETPPIATLGRKAAQRRAYRGKWVHLKPG